MYSSPVAITLTSDTIFKINGVLSIAAVLRAATTQNVWYTALVGICLGLAGGCAGDGYRLFIGR